jgi:hypothetical protein
MISALQCEAWALCNAGYHESNGGVYRALARALYEQDVHERIAALLARGDRQNRELEAAIERTTRMTA